MWNLRGALAAAPEIAAQLLLARGKLLVAFGRAQLPHGVTLWQLGAGVDQREAARTILALRAAMKATSVDLDAVDDALARLRVIAVPDGHGFDQRGYWRGRGRSAVAILLLQPGKVDADELARSITGLLVRRVPGLRDFVSKVPSP
jgi:hypothetical protein